MAERARFAFGSRGNIDAALKSGAIDAYDLLCLSGEGERPSIGWIDKNGNPVFVECVKCIEVVSALPDTGEEGIIYMLKGKGHVWYEDEFIPMADDIDLSALEAEIATKVDAATVGSMIETAIAESAGIKVIEF